MAFPNLIPLLPGTPQVLPLQDRALSWACSVCIHTLALAAAAVATVPFRELPHAAEPVYRLEILLSGAQDESGQGATADSPVQPDPTPLQETFAPAEDLSPIMPTSSPPIVQRTAQRVTTKTPPQQTTDRSTEIRDQFPVESSETIKHPSELLASASTPNPPAPLDPTETVEQPELTPATSSSSKSSEKNLADHTESPSQPDTSSSSPTDATPPTSMSGAQVDAVGSPAAPAGDTVAMTHPVVTQSISASSRYAWLMDLLRRRIISLQAYPHLARTQGWEGVVVVKTTINSNGDLVDAVVTKSSGYGALDEDAVRLMHRVCPVHLTHDLGKSKIAVMVPIRYRLDGFEH